MLMECVVESLRILPLLFPHLNLILNVLKFHCDLNFDKYNCECVECFCCFLNINSQPSKNLIGKI